MINILSRRLSRAIASLSFLALVILVIPPDAGATPFTINATFQGFDAASMAVINNAISFYENSITTPITDNIFFYNMGTGLGQSIQFIFTGPYSNVRNALAANQTSADDASALASLGNGSVNPVNGNANITLSSSNGRALGLNTPEDSFNFPGSPCPNFTGSGCIGLNASLANSQSDLLAVTEHEIDEVLGLGSALNGTSTPGVPRMEDLFRYASVGVRSYSANASTTVPCAAGTPVAYFSIDGGLTNLDGFNNCANGGDYGDWVTHSPSQVQDAFTDLSGTPSLSLTSPEMRALDVIGYNLNANQAVPEPSSFVLLLSGIGGIAFFFCARRK